MFDKLKQMNELRKIQAEVAEEHSTVERDGISVTVNGSLVVESLTLNSEKSANEQQEDVLVIINEAFKDVQTKVAQKMRGLMQG